MQAQARCRSPDTHSPPKGSEAIKERGRVGGRPLALSAAQRDEEDRRLTEIARLFRVSMKTVRRA